jgi:hypothetical protein
MMGGGCASKGFSAASCVEAFISNWTTHFWSAIDSHFKQGNPVLFSFLVRFLQKLGVRHIMTRAYYP